MYVPLDITVKNKVTPGIFLLGTSFVTVISREPWGDLLYCLYFYMEPFSCTYFLENIVPLGPSGNNS
jgi:hypothetical protein